MADVMQKMNFAFPFEILTPWDILPDDGEALVTELNKELRDDAPLYGAEVSAIAHRIDCDDVLFMVTGMENKFAVVHLTWSGKRDFNKGFPSTTFYRDLDSWKKDCMIPDHQDNTM